MAGVLDQRGGARHADARDRTRRVCSGRGCQPVARHRRIGIRSGRPLSSWPRSARARPRRAGRDAVSLARPLSDPVDRGPVRRGRRQGVRALHRRGRRPRPGDRRRLSRHQRRPGARRGAAAQRQRGSDQGQPGGDGQRSQGGPGRRASRRLRHDRLGAFGRDGGHVDRSSGDRLGRRAAQGRLVRALRADGEMERGAAHRGGARFRRRASPGSTKCRCAGRRRDRWKLRLEVELNDERSHDRERRARNSRARRGRRSRLQRHSLCRRADRAFALATARAGSGLDRRAADRCFRTEFGAGRRLGRHRPQRRRHVRGLPLSQRLDAGRPGDKRASAGDGLDSWRRLRRRLRRGTALRRRASRRARHRGRHRQPSAQCAGFPRSSRTHGGIGSSRLGRVRFSRPCRRAQMGQAQHRALSAAIRTRSRSPANPQAPMR